MPLAFWEIPFLHVFYNFQLKVEKISRNPMLRRKSVWDLVQNHVVDNFDNIMLF